MIQGNVSAAEIIIKRLVGRQRVFSRSFSREGSSQRAASAVDERLGALVDERLRDKEDPAPSKMRKTKKK